MGSSVSYFTTAGVQLILGLMNYQQLPAQTDDILYAIFDPTQNIQPLGRTKNIIHVLNKNHPGRLSNGVFKGCNTVWKSFKRSVWRLQNENFLGFRKLNIDQPGNYNQTFQSNSKEEYIWKSWQEVDDIVECLSASIVKKQLCPLQKFQAEDTPDMKLMGIFSENRLEWFISELACCSDSIAIVPVPVSFASEQDITYIIEFTEITSIFVSQRTVQIIFDSKSKGNLQKLKNIISYDVLGDTYTEQAQKYGINILNFNDLVSEGQFLNEVMRQEPKPNTILVLGVTSGTTGKQKMPMLTHMNLICGLEGQRFLGFNFNERDSYLSYVPLTHVQEQLLHVSAITFGFKIGYSSNDIQNLIKDIQIFKPTIFGSFPAFYNKIYSKINEKIKEMPKYIQTMLEYAVESKMWYFMKYGFFKNIIFDTILFQQIKSLLGGNIRLFISGGAPLDIEIKQFLSVVFSAPIIEAYGCTETGGQITGTSVYDREGGHVGGVLPSNMMQLRDMQELNIVTDSKIMQGEIYLKGNSIFKGYFKDQELTKQSIDNEGWYKLGDVGILRKNGSIEVLDRVQEMKKLQNGEFIAPSKLESIYVNAPLVERIYIDVNSSYNFLVAIVHLNQEKLLQYAQVNGLEDEIENLKKCKDVEYGVLKQLDRLAITNNLKNFEKIRQVHIAQEDFSFQNGMLTNTQKMRRNEIKKKFKVEIDKMYFEVQSQQQRYLTKDKKQD